MYILTFTFCVFLSVFDCSITSRAWMTPMEWARLDHPPNKWNNIMKITRLLIGDNLQKLGINLVIIFRVLPVMVENDQPNQLLQLFNQLMKLFDQCNHYLFVLTSVMMLPILMGNHHTKISGQNPDRCLIISESSSKCSMKCKQADCTSSQHYLYFKMLTH